MFVDLANFFAPSAMKRSSGSAEQPVHLSSAAAGAERPAHPSSDLEIKRQKCAQLDKLQTIRLTAQALASKAASSSRENLVGKTVLVRDINGCVLSLPVFANKEKGANRYRIAAHFPISSALAEKNLVPRARL